MLVLPAGIGDQDHTLVDAKVGHAHLDCPRAYTSGPVLF